MLDFQFAGLPLHVLLVHVMIVGVPLLALLLVVVCAWPGARRALWLPTLLGALVLLGIMYVTIEAGKWLQERVPEAPLIEAHTAQGEDIIPWMIGLATVAALAAPSRSSSGWNGEPYRSRGGGEPRHGRPPRAPGPARVPSRRS